MGAIREVKANGMVVDLPSGWFGFVPAEEISGPYSASGSAWMRARMSAKGISKKLQTVS